MVFEVEAGLQDVRGQMWMILRLLDGAKDRMSDKSAMARRGIHFTAYCHLQWSDHTSITSAGPLLVGAILTAGVNCKVLRLLRCSV